MPGANPQYFLSERRSRFDFDMRASVPDRNFKIIHIAVFIDTFVAFGDKHIIILFQKYNNKAISDTNFRLRNDKTINFPSDFETFKYFAETKKNIILQNFVS